ncbi:LamG domain-containing protein [Paenibacillus qinlingensis]|uniref:LamG-like jellyroll fold domain-containing protein n=1 Tax=Paenibacillus qinlingensis TaxID=1837343 RepID=A0ABU1NRT5_9BACL|nr:LamG domain-containing protein [Paenibacillus qinlingensis]MDR6550181.1 hypothetical protein [Paenibacillus qinlingensis]
MKKNTDIITKHPNLVSFWDFQEGPGQARMSKGKEPYALLEGSESVERDDEGIFGPYSALLEEGKWFRIPRQELSKLNIHGENAQVTVVAWVKRRKKSNKECEFVAGIWNETNKKRQYGLFVNLSIWESGQQVCGHVSSLGGPTPGYRWCMDSSIGNTEIPLEEWHLIAFTYDGEYVRSYLNGKLDERPVRNPYHYPGGLFDGGADGADFTVGAVNRSNEIGNFFVGSIGGLAIYNHALTDEEIYNLAYM